MCSREGKHKRPFWSTLLRSRGAKFFMQSRQRFVMLLCPGLNWFQYGFRSLSHILNKSIRNIPHMLRLGALKSFVKGNRPKPPVYYSDFGRSNGYLTNLFSSALSAEKLWGSTTQTTSSARAPHTQTSISIFWI